MFDFLTADSPDSTFSGHSSSISFSRVTTPLSSALLLRACHRRSAPKRSSLALVQRRYCELVFAGLTTQLLQIVGLLLAGGILLLWVCWKMWRELRASTEHTEMAVADGMPMTADTGDMPRKTLAQATWQIIVADVSMSLDNVLAVAGAAREHPWVLVFGLALSIAMMGIAASFIARLLQNHRWIAYVGLAVILYVAGDMIYRGTLEVFPRVAS